MGEDRSLSRREDDWGRRATAAAIAAAQRVATETIPASTPISRLSESEWGWIAATIIFAWIQTRAEQAVAEGASVERTIRITGFAEGEPWTAGAIAAVLPELADVAEVDWAQPLNTWSRETMVGFLLAALRLIRDAEIARDLGGGSITRKADTTKELPNDDLPF